MKNSKFTLRNQDKYIIAIFLIVMIFLFASVFLLPEQWIINATSTSISLMVYSMGLLIFRVIFSTDQSGKRRVRTGIRE